MNKERDREKDGDAYIYRERGKERDERVRIVV